MLYDNTITAVAEALLAPVVVLDDDPTGAQTLAGVRVLLEWDRARVAAALTGRPSVHLITNSRALVPMAARERVAEAAATALASSPDAHLVLRGDSTLRGHLLEEYQAVASTVAPGSWPPLLLAPALPAAGRITRHGIHMMRRNGAPIPLHDTEYARDGVFTYANARLAAWAEERSHGFFAAENARELDLFALRSTGPEAVTKLLQAASRRGVPAVIAPDAETDEDLHLIAEGYAAAVRAGAPALARCAPAFAGILTGTTAADLVVAPQLDRGHLLVVCGSYVPTSARQLEAVRAMHPRLIVEADASALAGRNATTEHARVAQIASNVLHSEHIAVIAIDGTPLAAPRLDVAERVAAGLARIVQLVEPQPEIVIAKGGITSTVTLRDGFGTFDAEVIGPVLPGVSYWRAEREAAPLHYFVVPGNVGPDDLLVRLLDLIAG